VTARASPILCRFLHWKSCCARVLASSTRYFPIPIHIGVEPQNFQLRLVRIRRGGQCSWYRKASGCGKRSVVEQKGTSSRTPQLHPRSLRKYYCTGTVPWVHFLTFFPCMSWPETGRFHRSLLHLSLAVSEGFSNTDHIVHKPICHTDIQEHRSFICFKYDSPGNDAVPERAW
jgi:hypothetical protein